MSNELVVRYDSDYGAVELTRSVVRNYLTKGNIKILDEEVDMYMEICKRQRLDPFVGGEVHLIKYKEGSPAQIVIGYRTYVRRAEENPKFIMKQDGIIVQRATQVIAKEGTCLYPNEKLLGGWCKAFLTKGGGKAYVYKEISLGEFYQDARKWKESPAFMINKVAIAQALRDAFPKEMNGLYIPEEIAPEEAKEGDFEPVVVGEVKLGEIQSPIISTEDRKELFSKVKDKLGSESGTEWLKEQVKALGLDSTTKLTEDNLKVIYENLNKDSEPIEADVIELDDMVQCVLDVVEEESRKDK